MVLQAAASQKFKDHHEELREDLEKRHFNQVKDAYTSIFPDEYVGDWVFVSSKTLQRQRVLQGDTNMTEENASIIEEAKKIADMQAQKRKAKMKELEEAEEKERRAYEALEAKRERDLKKKLEDEQRKKEQ